MKKINNTKGFSVCFLSHHYASPQAFLNTLLKMTPKCSGKWKEMTLITDPMKADFCVVIDGISHVSFPRERTLYFGQHPINVSSTFRNFKGVKQLASFPLDKYLNPGEYWIPHDYDTLMKLKPTKKRKDLCTSIIYHKQDRVMRHKRILFMRKLAKIYKNVDLYGRPEEDYRNDEELKDIYRGCLGKNKFNAYIGEHFLGKEKVGKYRYELSFDVGKTINYISERFYDALLLWTMPIYFGSTNVEKFLPENSFRYIDLDNWEDDNEVERVIDIVNSDFREKNLKAMKEARYLLLNKYQTVAYIYDKIKEL